MYPSKIQKKIVGIQILNLNGMYWWLHLMLMMMKQSRAEHTQQLTPFHTSHIAKLILDALPSLGLA